jgi:hypothetical protein
VTNHRQFDTYYMVMANAAAGSTLVIVSVNPSMLTFTKVGEKTSYTV